MKWLLLLIILASFLGFLDASYLTVQHYRDGILPCIGFTGCEQVTTSKYSSIGSVPISLLGGLYYLVIFISAIIFWDTKNNKALKVISYLPIVGFITSIFLLYLQLFVIHAICTYCVVSLITSTLLFVFGLKAIKLKT